MEATTQVLDREEITVTPGSAAKLIREVRAKTHRQFSAEDKIRIVLEGFRKEIAISDLCRREGISSALYYSWLKDFMEAGKARLKGDSNLVPSRRSAYIVMAETLPQIQDLMAMANKEHEEVWVSCKFRCEKCENEFLKNRRER